MSRFKNSTVYKDGNVAQQVVLPTYMLDSSLVLLPGIIYNVTFSRFKAAALLSRFREKVEAVPLVRNLLAEYDFDSSESEAATVSQDAIDGISQFYCVENQIKQGSRLGESSPKPSPSADFDWLVLSVVPNLGKIPEPSQSQIQTNLDITTVCRVVGITDDSNNVKLTLQALVRATKVPGYKKRANESLVNVLWVDKVAGVSTHLQALKSSTGALFSLIDKFVEEYRQAMTSQNKSSDLLTLNPLANAFYLQLAGSKDFSKAYSSLQKILTGFNGADAGTSKGLLRIIDLVVAIVPFPNHEKLKMLSATDLKDRAVELNIMVGKMTEVFRTIKENNAIMNHWFYNEASNIQKANLVANQLKSIRLVLEGLTNGSKRGANEKQLVRRKNTPTIRKPIDDHSADNDDEGDDDDLRAISDFIKTKLPEIASLSDDSKRLILKDFRRIKSASPGNADFHVIRNYLEIVADMPWDTYVAKFESNKDVNIEDARRQLDQDHYGLENVKTRLIQYLVVLKLLGQNAEREYQKLGLKNEKEKKLQEKESRKFTRESANGETIIIPNNDETRAAKDKAQKLIKRTRNLTQEGKDAHYKALLASKNNKSPIIMLAGPPGVGKTSLAKSIASTLGRKFQRVSLGGVKDESEIRGHRRTYVGAMPGTIVQALRKARSMNPVILLDEIDKIVGGHNSANKINGDPAAALLEVLDPEQNTEFIDHYLGFPIDLSQVIFVCTANEPYNLSRPLLDRLEMIEIGAYDYNEKLVIGNKYLLPRQIRRNGFPEDNLVYLEEDVMKKVILDYTREAGVRNFERKLGNICRHKAVEYAESLADPIKGYQPKVEEYDLSRYLGLPHPSLSSEIVDLPVMSSKYGVVNGLSYNSDGSGSVLIFESIGFNNEKGGTSLNMTGRLGEVLMESAKIGMTFIKNTLHKHLLNLSNTDALIEKYNNLEIHMHVPSGAVSKDGPSAGITMALLFLSLILEKPVPLNIAMTGEITLRGLVLPIGGLKEKILGAHLTGHINKVIVPRDNRRDVLEEYVAKINDPSGLNELLRDNTDRKFKNTEPEDYFLDNYGIKIVYAREFWDVIRHAWGDELVVKVEQARVEEYHL